MKDLVQNDSVIVKYLQTDCMIADVLTKPLSAVKHDRFIRDMNVKI